MFDRQAYDRAWYQRNKKRRQAINTRHRRKMRAWIRSLKAARGCDKCPERDPVCLDWHHRNPEEKELTIGEMASMMRSKAAVIAEMAKCDLLCANCHRKLHRADDDDADVV